MGYNGCQWFQLDKPKVLRRLQSDVGVLRNCSWANVGARLDPSRSSFCGKCGISVFVECSFGDRRWFYNRYRGRPPSYRAIRCQTACKPGSVPRACARGDGHSSGTPVAGRLARPTRAAARKPAWPAPSPGRRGRPAAPTWSCSRWGLPCRSRCRERGALLPHPFTLAGRRKPRVGGLLSVALSLRSPSPGVTRHRVPVEPGLSSPRAAGAAAKGGHPAVWPLLPRGRRSCRQAARGGRRAGRRSRHPPRRSEPWAGTAAERPARLRESPRPDSRSRSGPGQP